MTTIPIAQEVRPTFRAERNGDRATGPVAPSQRPSRTHLPGLDGVRAIAILMVIACHALSDLPGMTWSQNAVVRVASQGWAGVDLFFVLSGFLITGILIDARGSPHVMRNFYARRILRIVPAYVAFLFFSLWIATIARTSSADEVAQLHRTQLWYWTYSQNILIALHNWGASTFPTAHLWSLAVEEQFYLLWPMAVLLMSPVTLRRTAIACVASAEICRVALILHGVDGQVNYVLLPTRMDTLAAGSFLASAYRDPEIWKRVLKSRQALTFVALLLMLVSLLRRGTIDNQSPLEQMVVFPAIVALAAVAVASAAAGTAWLSNKTLQFVARISYGMYLWHVVARRLVLMKVREPLTSSPHDWWLFYALMIVGSVLGAVVLALISWYLIEQPFLRLKRFVPNG